MIRNPPHAFGVDDIALTLVSVPNPVPSAGHFNRALLGIFSRAPRSKGTETTPPAPPLQFCPLCHAAFFEDVEIARHVQTIHGPQHIYLRVNGRIIRDIGWAEQGISELRLVLLGFSQAAVEMAGVRLHRVLTVAGDENLQRLIPPSFEGELALRVEPVGATRASLRSIRGHFPVPARQPGRADPILERPGHEARGTPDIGRWRELTGDMGVLETDT